MLTLNDGRDELWQWDTGRTLSVDADCSQVHFSNKVFGRSIDVDVTDGVAIIPDILLQTDNDLNVWAFVGAAENGYTKISKTFKVNRRNKPADYVFTPTDQMTLQTIQSQIGDLSDLTTEAKDTLVAAINEAARTGGGAGSMELRVADGYVQYSRDGGMTWTNLIAMAELKGADGITPTIGPNGNWYLGAEDTGKPSRGETGPQGTPGIYYGTTQPTGDTHPVWIDPDGGPDDGGLLPAVTAADNGKVLRVDNGAWAPADMPTGGTDMGITGAAVGQIAKITAVDDTGVPTAWEPVDMPGGGEDKFVLLSDTTIDEDVIAISMAIPPCKKIKAYFEGHQVFSDGSETSTKFTNLTAEFDVDGNRGLRAFYTLNDASRFNSDVVSVITFDVSSPPFASGELYRIFPDGQNTGSKHEIVTNEIAITAASAITKITIYPMYNFVSGVGNVGRFASGGRFRIYGVKA